MTAKALSEKVVNHMLSQDEFSKWLGIELVSIDSGSCSLKMKIRKEMLNGFNKCHGGIPFSLADSALAFAANSHGRIAVAIENNINYPAPVEDGDVLTATAVEQHLGNRIAVYNITVTNQNKATVAIFRGTVYRTKEEFFPEK